MCIAEVAKKGKEGKHLHKNMYLNFLGFYNQLKNIKTECVQEDCRLMTHSLTAIHLQSASFFTIQIFLRHAIAAH